MNAPLTEVGMERENQDKKWGEQNHPDFADWHGNTFPTGFMAKTVCQQSFERNYGSWTHVLFEEVAEAIDEARIGNEPALREELVQVAAVAVAWIEAIDRRNG